MNRTEAVPLARILRHLPPATDTAWVPPAFQGPGGLFALRSVEGDANRAPMFQVVHLTKKDRHAYDVSGPHFTREAAEKFARGMADGGSPPL